VTEPAYQLLEIETLRKHRSHAVPRLQLAAITLDFTASP
jgi:hypothetical protein